MPQEKEGWRLSGLLNENDDATFQGYFEDQITYMNIYLFYINIEVLTAYHAEEKMNVGGKGINLRPHHIGLIGHV